MASGGRVVKRLQDRLARRRGGLLYAAPACEFPAPRGFPYTAVPEAVVQPWEPERRPAMSPAEPAVDLRSDTVTRPTPAMRRAMMDAEVGDDVFGDDPTVQALERRVAELAGKEAALYVPSGTMGNQLALKCHTEPGDEVLLERESHIFLYEQGGLGANSGCLAHLVAGRARRARAGAGRGRGARPGRTTTWRACAWCASRTRTTARAA